jgi:hypothetical protein
VRFDDETTDQRVVARVVDAQLRLGIGERDRLGRRRGDEGEGGVHQVVRSYSRIRVIEPVV